MIGRRVLWLSAAAALGAVALVLALAGPSGGGRAQLPVHDQQYVAKALCGVLEADIDADTIADFSLPMRTAINVHNPNVDSTSVDKKAVMAPREDEASIPHGDLLAQSITPDGAFEVDCPDIYSLLGATAPVEDAAGSGSCSNGMDDGGDTVADMDDPDCFVKGFVVIHAFSTEPLDVVGVYSAQRVLDAGTPGVGHSIEFDTIQARALDQAPVLSPSLYSAKFACGTLGGIDPDHEPLEPGDYFTAINVHNPNPDVVDIDKKFVIARSELEAPEPPTAWFFRTLEADEAFEIDCADIIDHLPSGTCVDAVGNPFCKGWVVLSANYELDVTGVYATTEEVPIDSDGDTVPDDGGVGLSIDIEPVNKSSVIP